MICDECETVAHCMKNGCVPKTNKKDEAISTERAMKLALEALNTTESDCGSRAWEREQEAVNALREALAEQPAQQEPVGCEGAIVNGHVYADRLEHDYKFECEAGPLHMCNDWVEFRRCFEWLAQHTSPPASKPLTDEQIVAKALHLSGLGTISDVIQFARAIEAAHGIKGEA